MSHFVCAVQMLKYQFRAQEDEFWHTVSVSVSKAVFFETLKLKRITTRILYIAFPSMWTLRAVLISFSLAFSQTPAESERPQIRTGLLHHSCGVLVCSTAFTRTLCAYCRSWVDQDDWLHLKLQNWSLGFDICIRGGMIETFKYDMRAIPTMLAASSSAVSYTHLTLPTIYSV